MSAAQRYPSVRVRVQPSAVPGLPLFWVHCNACMRCRLRGGPPGPPLDRGLHERGMAHVIARDHARVCPSLGYLRLLWDVQDQADVMRIRAAHLKSEYRPFPDNVVLSGWAPWSELFAAARQLDELVAR